MALLENMRIFVRVVELGSLSAAGRSVRMSPAVVSNRPQQPAVVSNPSLADDIRAAAMQPPLSRLSDNTTDHLQQVV